MTARFRFPVAALALALSVAPAVASADRDLYGGTGVDRVFVKAKSTQTQQRSIEIGIRVGAQEAATATVKGKAALTGGKSAVVLKTATVRLVPTDVKHVDLRAKNSDDGQRLADRLHDGANAKARLSITFEDQAGNTALKHISVKLTG
jgi:hypothetical protein